MRYAASCPLLQRLTHPSNLIRNDMTLSLRLASLVIGSLFVLPLYAADVDPLWAKVVAQSDEGKKWVAKDVELSIEGKHDGEEKKAKIFMQLTGWEKDKAIYKTIKVEPPADPAKKGGHDGTAQVDKFSSMSEAMIKIDAPVERKDGQKLDGKPATLFVLTKSEGPADTKLQVWVDPASGSIFKILTHARVTFMMDMTLTMSYKPHASGISMPTQSDFKMDVLIPFKNSKMSLSTNASNWVQRPL
jgi:hypothetical protein